MSFFHAVVWLDHESAWVVRLRAQDFESRHIKAHHHNTRQHASGVRTEHEFFGAVCDDIAGISEVLVCGSHTTLADLRHYVTKHRPAADQQIAGWEVSERCSEPQLAAFARQYFEKHDRMAGFRTATRDPA